MHGLHGKQLTVAPLHIQTETVDLCCKFHYLRTGETLNVMQWNFTVFGNIGPIWRSEYLVREKFQSLLLFVN